MGGREGCGDKVRKSVDWHLMLEWGKRHKEILVFLVSAGRLDMELFEDKGGNKRK